MPIGVLFEFRGASHGLNTKSVLKVDDKEVANKKIPHTIPALMTIDETFAKSASDRVRRSTL